MTNIHNLSLERINGISVIICCYNSSKRIVPTLEYLLKQDFTMPWEVVLVDNASNDDTSLVAQQIWDTESLTIPLRIAFEQQSGLSYARKKGLNESKYELIVFCDDDNWLASDYLSNAFRIFDANKNIGICGGLGSPEFEISPPFWFKDIKSGYALGPQGDSEGEVARSWVYGAGMVVRKELLFQIEDIGLKSNITGRKGNELSSGEDVEICLLISLLGYDIWYSPQLKFQHFIPKARLSDDYLFRLYKGFGRANAMLKPLFIVKTKKERHWKSYFGIKVLSTTISLVSQYLSFSNNIWRNVRIIEDKERLRTYWSMKGNWNSTIQYYSKYFKTKSLFKNT